MSMMILVVEDQVELERWIRTALVSRGYAVRATRSASAAALILAEAPHPCLLLWDPLIRDSPPGETASLVGVAHRYGVRIAIIPVSAVWDETETPPSLSKRLLCGEALMSIVEQHCPLPEAA
jgi:response regulator RpfG family c-di-GMP phosphodiesterase